MVQFHSMTTKDWILLLRPWSYTATLIPFLVAAGRCSAAGDPDWLRWGLGLVAGLFFQVTVNLLNTWGDEKSGVDDVSGALRTTPQVHLGLISLHSLLVIALACAVAGSVLGISLILHLGEHGLQIHLPLLAIGFIGLAGATNYTTGIRFKYKGLGVPFVSLLMGPLEYAAAALLLQPDRIPDLAPSIPIAFLVGIIMHGNDMRDMPTDATAGIRTFATLLGVRGALAYYWTGHLLPYAICLFLPPLPLLALPLTLATLVKAIRVYRANPLSPPWRRLERDSARIHLIFGLLLALACHMR